MKKEGLGILAIFLVAFFGVYYFTQIDDYVTGYVSLSSLDNDVVYDTSNTQTVDVTVIVQHKVVEYNDPVTVIIDASKNHVYKEIDVYQLTATGRRGRNVGIIRDLCTNKYTEGNKRPLGQTGTRCRGLFTVPINTFGLFIK